MTLSKRILAVLGTGLVMTLASIRMPITDDDPPYCPPPEGRMPGRYPIFDLSPRQSIYQHDLVFFGEVLVPTRKCSLGYCAGLRILSSIKGTSQSNLLIHVDQDPDEGCIPDIFSRKGDRWVVFGNRGTSKTGLPYLFTEAAGPSFTSPTMPNFADLEGQYALSR